ncbi:hypothetical protein ABG79_00726 [Caloramator mitchellensis]|uniref:Uncharacterized protein n=1 Tax=Caloramator mitchellensis TaxID=908809 RepID=A0A0R3K281_CALMK|nr:hypothetical protein [Caloramator mitchellensis]KRQ87388.1 hypothetical protein ABG79_00726 [Caloramator mitchellensis]
MSKKETQSNEFKEMNYLNPPIYNPYFNCPFEYYRQQPFDAVPAEDSQMEPTLKDIAYTQAWLRTQVGKRVKIEFLIGTQMWIDKEGTLLEVGISYVVLRESSTNHKVMCDLYSIRFVTVFD